MTLNKYYVYETKAKNNKEYSSDEEEDKVKNKNYLSDEEEKVKNKNYLSDEEDLYDKFKERKDRDDLVFEENVFIIIDYLVFDISSSKNKNYKLLCEPKDFIKAMKEILNYSKNKNNINDVLCDLEHDNNFIKYFICDKKVIIENIENFKYVFKINNKDLKELEIKEKLGYELNIYDESSLKNNIQCCEESTYKEEFYSCFNKCLGTIGDFINMQRLIADHTKDQDLDREVNDLNKALAIFLDTYLLDCNIEDGYVKNSF
jgi:hypothetical protein